MALRVPTTGSSNLFKEGYKTLQGLEEAIIRNIMATKEISEMVRTSYGPHGKNKMIVNRLEKIFVTSDAATILQEVEVVHPAAKLLVMASQQQEAEVGDGTNQVVVFGSELLQKAEYLLRMGLHPSEIAQGYEKALEKAVEYLEGLETERITDVKDKKQIMGVVETAIGAKEYENRELLAKLVAEAVVAVMPKKSEQFNVDNIRVVKIMGGSMEQSVAMQGMVMDREPESDIRYVKDVKLAIFSCPFDVGATETKGTVVLHNADELLNYTKGEEREMEKVVEELKAAGVNAVACGAGLGDLALHYLDQEGILAVKVPSKFELRRLCRLAGGHALARLGAPTLEEMGYVDEIRVEEIGGDRVTVARNYPDSEKARAVVSTIVLRGATQNLLDDLERAVDDGVNVVKALTKDSRLVAGAGAIEMELHRVIGQLADSTSGTSQYAIRKFAEALEVFPRTIAENCGLDPTDTVAKLVAAHHQDKDTDTGAGINVEYNDQVIDQNYYLHHQTGEQEHNEQNEGEQKASVLLDARKAGIVEPLAVKLWGLRHAVHAALTVLQVDQIIMAKKAGGPKVNPK